MGAMCTIDTRLVLASSVLVLALITPASADVHLLHFDDIVHPASAQRLERAITVAEQQHSQALIITLRTPGGLVSSMREIVERILASRVPVVAFVAPSGANAASAGFFILISADVAAMAPGTNTGAAHPVAIGMEQDKTLFQKAENDAAAYIRSLAEKRGRNIELAEAAVRTSRSYTETEALRERLIDLVARDIDDLMRQLDGRRVRRLNGDEVVLRTKGERLVRIEPTLREQLLSYLANPNIAFVLGALGLLCLYFEFNHPGAIIPAVVGAISLVLALYGFHLLPVNLTGVVLMALALALFIAEAKIQSFGILGTGGVVAMVIGALILIDAPEEAVRIHPTIALGVAIPLAVAMIIILRLAMRAREQKVVTGDLGMVGLIGIADSDLEPEGRVFVRGELWSAIAPSRIARGERVRVVGIEGLRLRVEAAGPLEPPRQRSAVED
jgi:membrane-bound serine protease (ClpP class)